MVDPNRSYLWSVFVGELTAAAVALDDRPLCQQLLDDLLPVADTGPLTGRSSAKWVRTATASGSCTPPSATPDRARHWFERALAVHRRLGARAWEAETAAALAALAERPRIELRRVGDMWFAAYGGESAYLRDCKGPHDLATLLARPRVDVPAIELAGGAAPVESSDSVLDGRALAAYRRRLAELDDELAAADLGRRQRAGDEREALLGEIRRATRPGGSARPLGPTARERARKAVTARIRDALARVTDALPESELTLIAQSGPARPAGTTRDLAPSSARRSASLLRGPFVLGDKPTEHGSAFDSLVGKVNGWTVGSWRLQIEAPLPPPIQ